MGRWNFSPAWLRHSPHAFGWPEPEVFLSQGLLASEWSSAFASSGNMSLLSWLEAHTKGLSKRKHVDCLACLLIFMETIVRKLDGRSLLQLIWEDFSRNFSRSLCITPVSWFGSCGNSATSEKFTRSKNSWETSRQSSSKLAIASCEGFPKWHLVCRIAFWSCQCDQTGRSVFELICWLFLSKGVFGKVCSDTSRPCLWISQVLWNSEDCKQLSRNRSVTL